MPSTSAVLARPVRSRESSWRSDSTLLPMRACASFLMSLSMGGPASKVRPASIAGEKGRAATRAAGLSGVDQGAYRLALHDPHQVARTGHVIDPQRHVVIAAKRDGGSIHHLQVARDHVFVAD